jgi:hypothetical protein
MGVRDDRLQVKLVPLLLVVALVAAVLIVAFAAGWTDDKARPGSTGRAPVTRTSP